MQRVLEECVGRIGLLFTICVLGLVRMPAAHAEDRKHEAVAAMARALAPHQFRRGEEAIWKRDNVFGPSYHRVEVEYVAGDMVFIGAKGMVQQSVRPSQLSPKVLNILNFQSGDVVADPMRTDSRTRTIRSVYANGMAVFTNSEMPEALQYYTLVSRPPVPKTRWEILSSNLKNCIRTLTGQKTAGAKTG
jgi:hypothetical protein